MAKITIKDICPRDDFTIDITLSNESRFLFDLRKYFNLPFTRKMQDLAFFKQVKFKGELLYWDDMHDFPLHCMDILDDLLL